MHLNVVVGWVSVSLEITYLELSLCRSLPSFLYPLHWLVGRRFGNRLTQILKQCENKIDFQQNRKKHIHMYDFLFNYDPFA